MDDLTCPRCDGPLDDEHYGPCGSCRQELRAAARREGRTTDAEAFEPRMHVTPNAVATKE